MDSHKPWPRKEAALNLSELRGLPWILADHWNWLSRSDVVTQTPVSSRDAIEVLFENLFPSGKSIAPAHGLIIAVSLTKIKEFGFYSPEMANA